MGAVLTAYIFGFTAPVALSLYGVAGVLRRGRRRDYVIAGVGIGLAAATKYTGGITLLCLLAGVFPGLMIDALKPVVQLAVGAAMPLQSKLAWLSIAPILGVKRDAASMIAAQAKLNPINDKALESER